MARFKPGQEVVCTNGDGWYYEKTFVELFGFQVKKNVPIVGPKNGDIVTVDGYNNTGYVFLREYASVIVDGARGAYIERAFEPVVPQEEIEKLLEESKITA